MLAASGSVSELPTQIRRSSSGSTIGFSWKALSSIASLALREGERVARGAVRVCGTQREGERVLQRARGAGLPQPALAQQRAQSLERERDAGKARTRLDDRRVEHR